MTGERPQLRALAERLGILEGYWDVSGQWHETTAETAEALARAMGFEAASEAEAERRLAALAGEDRARVVAPVQVWRHWDAGAPALEVRPPADAVDWELALRAEDGRVERRAGRFQGGEAPVHLPLPFAPGDGYHTVELALEARGVPSRAEQLLVCTPRTCLPAGATLAGRPRFGVWANLYSVRSARDAGVGDLADLASLLRLAGRAGADFVGINPLHALRNRGSGISPYSPVTRLHRNPLYLALDAVPELVGTPALRAALGSGRLRAACDALRTRDRIDYDGVMSLKREALEAGHRVFAARHRGRDTERGRDYAAFRARGGEALTDFATFCALEEHLSEGRPHHVPFDAWPPDLRDRRSPEVVRFRAEHADRVDFHAWIQFELDRQLAEAAALARESGMAIGVYQDLAIGLAPDAADLWAFPGLFARGASVGAPPDDYAPEGQDWGLPPLDPRRLRDDRYGYFVRLLRAAFAHAGALRIDHVMGLFRLFWIPAGLPSARGAYVRYPADDLLGILALESHRHGALVVGEDLGTVPEEVPRALADWEVVSSRVLLFEREGGGAFRPSAGYPARAMVTANTHDLPTLAGFWEGRDLALRHSLGQLSDEALAAAREVRVREREALVARLRAEGLLPEDGALPGFEALRDAVHAFLCRTPSLLAGLSLDDLAGEREPVNLPGVGLDRFPSWSRRMGRTLEALARDPGLQESFAAARRLRPR